MIKKIVFLSVFLILLSGSIFADTAASAESSMALHAGTELNVSIDLGIKPSDMYFYAFGFSNKPGSDELPNEGKGNVPTSAEASLKLTYDNLTSTATNSDNDLYFYYKARTGLDFSFDIKVVGPMKDISGNGGPDITWNVEFEKVPINGSNTAEFSSKSIASNGTDSTTVTISPDIDTSETYSSYKVKISTGIIPLLSKDALYSGTLRMSVAGK